MGKIRIEYDREGCIGAGVCAAFAPNRWVMNNDGKADLVGSKKNDKGLFEVDIDESELEINKQAAEGCPVVVIHLIEKETGKKIF